jgi:hypothetical protein
MSFATKLCHMVYADGAERDVMKHPKTDSSKCSLPGGWRTDCHQSDWIIRTRTHTRTHTHTTSTHSPSTQCTPLRSQRRRPGRQARRRAAHRVPGRQRGGGAGGGHAGGEGGRGPLLGMVTACAGRQSGRKPVTPCCVYTGPKALPDQPSETNTDRTKPTQHQ